MLSTADKHDAYALSQAYTKQALSIYLFELSARTNNLQMKPAVRVVEISLRANRSDAIYGFIQRCADFAICASFPTCGIRAGQIG
jgi:hypothetical protein